MLLQRFSASRLTALSHCLAKGTPWSEAGRVLVQLLRGFSGMSLLHCSPNDFSICCRFSLCLLQEPRTLMFPFSASTSIFGSAAGVRPERPPPQACLGGRCSACLPETAAWGRKVCSTGRKEMEGEREASGNESLGEIWQNAAFQEASMLVICQ